MDDRNRRPGIIKVLTDRRDGDCRRATSATNVAEVTTANEPDIDSTPNNHILSLEDRIEEDEVIITHRRRLQPLWATASGTTSMAMAYKTPANRVWQA